jgi:hypothetical protein
MVLSGKQFGTKRATYLHNKLAGTQVTSESEKAFIERHNKRHSKGH